MFMSDVFVSYSRKDKAFVQQLHEALVAQKRDVWIDWEDIPATADWWREIQEGIDASNNVLFVISPDSAESKVCQQEINYAVSSNKRIIPILLRTVAGNQGLHPNVTSHNWVIFEGADFYQSFASLAKAMDTDLDHVRAHTRILTKAREWQDHQRNNSYLLAGVDIDEAELWLGKAAGKDPLPTPLHTDYILASRKAQRTRQQQLLIGVSIALMITVALAILSLFLFNDARQQRDIAYQARDTAVVAETQVFILYQEAVAAEATSQFFNPRVTIVPDSPINLYAIPDPDGEILGRLENTAEVVLFGITPDEEFFFVEVADTQGWMWTRDLATNSRSTIVVRPNIAEFDSRTGEIIFSRPR
jgi:hypothetical protein